jgi:hypothetical protein
MRRGYTATDAIEYMLVEMWDWVVNLGEITIWIVVVLGLLQCFLGYRMFLFYLWVGGAILGAILALLVVGWFQIEDPFSFVVLILGVLIGGALLVALHRVGVFVIGAVIGAGLVFLYGEYVGAIESEVPYIVVGIIVGIAAVLVEKHVVIVLTALSGSVMVVGTALEGNLSALVKGDVERMFTSMLNNRGLGTGNGTGDLRMLVVQFVGISLVLAAAGIFTQYKTTKEIL